MKETPMTSAELSAQDADIVRRVLEGDDRAFDELVTRYHRKLFHTAFGVLGNSEDAEEAAQDAFVKAFRNLKSFRSDSSFYTWIQRIALNTARDKFQWLKRRGPLSALSLSGHTEEGLGEEDFQVPSEAYAPDRLLAGQESMHRLEEAFKSLPESMRETMTLRHIENLSYEEVASILDCNVGTVKSRLARGRELLIKQLAGEW